MDEEMRRYEKIRGAYRSVGRLANLYDGMMTYSTWSGKFVSRLVWGMGREEVSRYVGLALRAAHEGFDGRLLEVPVGTGCLSLPVYAELPNADITCLDYSPAMLAAARARADALGIHNVAFVEGDVGQLTFEDDFFDAAVKHLYTRMGFFTPPYDTKEQLEARLKALYREVTVECVESLACFSCVK